MSLDIALTNNGISSLHSTSGQASPFSLEVCEKILPPILCFPLPKSINIREDSLSFSSGVTAIEISLIGENPVTTKDKGEIVDLFFLSFIHSVDMDNESLPTGIVIFQ